MYTNLSLLRSLSIGGRFFTCFHRIKNEKMIRDQTYNKKALFSLCILSGELVGAKNRRKLFSLPICVIIGIMKKPLPLGEVAA